MVLSPAPEIMGGHLFEIYSALCVVGSLIPVFSLYQEFEVNHERAADGVKSNFCASGSVEEGKPHIRSSDTIF